MSVTLGQVNSTVETMRRDLDTSLVDKHPLLTKALFSRKSMMAYIGSRIKR